MELFTIRIKISKLCTLSEIFFFLKVVIIMKLNRVRN